ncbi:hypothetical protein ACFE04_010375 [Oxalis oulophora]
MRREGRQHGTVLTCRLLPLVAEACGDGEERPPNSGRVVNKVELSSAAGFFSKVSSKPTNHSKFTGKCKIPRCETCHARPCSKSKDKSKGCHKFKSFDLDIDGDQSKWSNSRAVDGRQDLYLPGFSVSKVLDEFDEYDYEEYEDFCMD